MDIAGWLRGLGLEQYASAFRDNDIEAETLAQLTPGDLIALGVTSVGHRRKLLSAVEALSGDSATMVKDFWAVPYYAKLLDQMNGRIAPFIVNGQGTAKEALDGLDADWKATIAENGCN